MIREPCGHRWRPLPILFRSDFDPQGPHTVAVVAAVQREIGHCLMDSPVLREPIALPHLAAVAEPIRPVRAFDEHRVDESQHRPHQRRCQVPQRPEYQPGFDLHHPVLFPNLMDRGVDQVLGQSLDGRLARRHYFRLCVDLGDGRGIGRVFVRTDQVDEATIGPLVQFMHQLGGVLVRAFADNDAEDQAVFGIKGDMVPAIATAGIFGFGGIAVFLLLGDKGPFLIQLGLLGRGGKRPRVRRGFAERGCPP